MHPYVIPLPAGNHFVSIFCPDSAFLSTIQVTHQDHQELRRDHFFWSSPQLFMIHTVNGSTLSIIQMNFSWNSLEHSSIQQVFAVRSQMPLSFLFPAWTSTFHGPYKVGVFVASPWASLYLCQELEQWMDPQLLHPLTSAFLKTGMYMECFQSIGHCFVFHICWHILLWILTDSVSVARNNSIGLLFTPVICFFPVLSRLLSPHFLELQVLPHRNLL